MYALHAYGLVNNALAVTIAVIILIMSVVAGFLRFSTLRMLPMVLVICIPFFVLMFALIYAELGIVPPDGVEPAPFDYLYFSVVTFTTLGYGDFRPTEASRVFAAMEALLGYVILGIFVSLLVTLNPHGQGQAPPPEPGRPRRHPAEPPESEGSGVQLRYGREKAPARRTNFKV